MINVSNNLTVKQKVAKISNKLHWGAYVLAGLFLLVAMIGGTLAN